jgi:hypothetical protein
VNLTSIHCSPQSTDIIEEPADGAARACARVDVQRDANARTRGPGEGAVAQILRAALSSPPTRVPIAKCGNGGEKPRGYALLLRTAELTISGRSRFAAI